VYFWDKTSDKDVGHTAIRIDGTVYGFYPTDIDGDGAYTLNDLTGSPGEMHINSLENFNKIYSGNNITAIRLNITRQQAKDLMVNLLRISVNPPNYSLTGNNCTTVAYNALITSGVYIAPGPSPSLGPNSFKAQLSNGWNYLFGQTQSIRNFTVK
jgi:hypothetical protein